MDVTCAAVGSEIAAVVIITVIASCLQTIAGFGFALLAVPTLAVAVDPRTAVIVCTGLGLSSSGLQAILERRHTRWPLVRRLLTTAYLAMPVGLIVFVTVSDDVLKVLLAIGVLGAVVVLVRGVDLSGVRPGFDLGMGALSGILSTSIGTNGPPLVFGLRARRLTPTEFRATLASVFVGSGLVTLGLFVVSGRLGADELRHIAVGLPCVGVGVTTGRRISRVLAPERFERIVIGLLILAAIAALASAAT